MKSEQSSTRFTGAQKYVLDNELAKIVSNITGQKTEVRHEDGESDLRNNVFTTEVAKDLIGFEATCSLENGLKSTLKWVKSYID